MTVNNMDSMMSVNTINSLLKQAWGVESISTTNTQLFVSDATKTLVAGSYKGLILKLIATINPKQSGSGGPSPDNIRPISGWNEVKTYVTPTASAEDGTIYTEALPETVYGGSLDFVNGVLTVDRAMVDMGTLDWSYQSSWASWYTDYFADIKGTNTGAETPNFVSDRFVAIATNYGLTPQDRIGITSTTRGSSGCRILVKNGSTTEAPTGQLCYELAESRTIQLTPKQVTTLLGTNNVWADSGDVTVEYWDDTGTIKTDSGRIVTFNII